MPIPALNEEGLLPEGVHDCTLDEIAVRFGRFQQSDRRVQLFVQLRELIEEERRAGLAVAVIVDGSFVTQKLEPGDIDLVIVLPEGYNLGVELPLVQYNAISKTHLRRRYRFDVFVAIEDSPEYKEWLALFQRDKWEYTRRKGILRVEL